MIDADARRRSPIRKFALPVVTLLLVATAVMLGAHATRGATFNPRSPEGGSVVLSDLRDPGSLVSVPGDASRPRVISVFASWCATCREEIRTIEATSRAAKDVEFLGVDHRDSRSSALALVGSSGTQLPIVFDPSGRFAASYGIFAIPTTLFFSREGRIVTRWSGEITATQMTKMIKEINS